MNRYYSKTDAPLAFHNFNRYLSLPCGALVTTCNLVKYCKTIKPFSWFYLYDMGYYIVFLALAIIGFIGFLNWKSYAWYCEMAILALTSLYYIGAVIMYSVYLPDKLAHITGQLIGYLIYATLVGIYYIKRKPLFVADMPNPETNIIGTTHASLKYCGECGAPLAMPDSRFCDKCGVKTENENEQ